MLHHDAQSKNAFASSLALGLVVALLSAIGALAGCDAQAPDELPGTHLDQAGKVAASHGRCGACHQGGTRGNGSYIALDYTGTESLPLSEFAIEVPPEEPSATQSWYPETADEEGPQ